MFEEARGGCLVDELLVEIEYHHSLQQLRSLLKFIVAWRLAGGWRCPGLDAVLLHVENPLLHQLVVEGLPLRVGVDALLGQSMHSRRREDVGLEAQLAHQVRKLERVNNDPSHRVVLALGKLVQVLPEQQPLPRGRLEEVDDRSPGLGNNSSAPLSSQSRHPNPP